MRTLVVAVISLGALTACGGGGGSDWLSFDRYAITVNMYEGESPRVSLTGTADGDRADVQYGVVVDGAFFVTSSISIVWAGERSERFSARLVPTFTVGQHTSSIEVRACLDDPTVCTEPFGGSPWIIPVTVNVAANPGNPTTPANGGFATDTAGWAVQQFSGTGSISATGGELHADITSGGYTNEYAVYVYSTAGLNLESGRTYQFSFDARAESARTIETYIGEAADRDGDGTGWIYIQPVPTVNLTTTMQTFSYQFTMTETDRAARIMFLLGGSDADVFIDDVTVTDITPG